MRILLLTAAVLSVAPAAAQPPGPPPDFDRPQTRADAEKQAADRFARWDANGDGKVTREEMAVAREGGSGADAPPPPAPPPPPPRRGGRRGPGSGAMMFERLDANGDGAVTVAEASARTLERFDRMDADHDGTVTPDERRAAMRRRD